MQDGHCLYSGGVEPYLSLHTFPSHRTRLRLPPLSSSSVHLARTGRILLLCYPDCLQLWRLGDTSTSSGPIGAFLPLDRGEPAKLAEVRLKAGEMLVTAAISDCASYLAFATTAPRLRLLKISREDGSSDRLRLERVALTDSDSDTETEPVHHLLLPPGRLITVCPHSLTLFPLPSRVASQQQQQQQQQALTVPLTQLGLEGAVSRVASSQAVLVMVDTQDTAVSLALTDLSLLARLNTSANISAISLSPDSQTVLVSYSNNRLVELRTDTGKTTRFSREQLSEAKLPKSWLSRRTSVTDILHLGADLILLKDQDCRVLAVLDKDKQMPEPSSKLFFTDPTNKTDCSVSMSSLGSTTKLEQALASGLRMSRKYDHLVSLHHLGGDELVAVEVKPSLIESQLPPSLKQKKFGLF